MRPISPRIMHLALPVLTACPVEQTYADLIEEHGGTYASQSASHSGSITGDDNEDTSTPTSTSPTTGSASTNTSSGDVPTTTSGESTSTASNTSIGEIPVDAPPQLDDLSVTPNPVLAAGFIELTADCTDDVGVHEVRFLVDGQPLASASESPFTAKWLVKSQDQAGDHTLTAECEDTAGQIVFIEKPASVTLPATGSIAWTKVHPSLKNNAEARDVAPAPDGSWWVCGYADNPVGGTSAWVAHYSPGGEPLFDDVIFHGKDQTGVCDGIAVASEDGHRAVLTGGYGPTGLMPSMWTALVDETEQNPLLAESDEALTGHWGNDILVNQYGQFEIAGARYVGGDDWDMVHQVYGYVPDDDELVSYVGLTYGDPDKFDMASAIVENPDGTVTLIGTCTQNSSKLAAVKLDDQHAIDNSEGWPFYSATIFPEGAGALDGVLDANGNLQLTGWYRSSANAPSQVIVVELDPEGNQIGDTIVETQPQDGDNIAHAVTHLDDGTVVVAGSITTNVPTNHDIWVRRYDNTNSMAVFQGVYGLLDEPRAARTNSLNQVLIAGFETVFVLQDGNLVATRRAWLRAYY